MLEKYNRYKLLKVFMDNPTESFRLRELSRLSKISPPSVMIYLKEFEKEKLIEKQEKRKIPFYKANRDNEDFKQYKKLSIIYEIHKSGLIEYLWEKLAPETIVLYGSFAKGESIENSDLDIFFIGKDKEINIDEYEKKLGYEVHLMGDELKNTSKEFRNNLANGMILKGYLKLLN